MTAWAALLSFFAVLLAFVPPVQALAGLVVMGAGLAIAVFLPGRRARSSA
jgi:low temperature requirement protein LtrA